MKIAIIVKLYFVFMFVLCGANAAMAVEIDLTTAGWLYRHSEGGLSGKITTTKYNLAIAPLLVITNGIGVGGKFVYDLEQNVVPGTSMSKTFAAIGPSVGYASAAPEGFCALATLLMYPTSTVKSSGESTRHGGSGYSLDAGFRMTIGKIILGPIFSLYSVTYKTETSDSYESTLADGAGESWIQGYLGFWYKI